MKIEIGESLVCSWLKHVRQCQLVQLNWKVSPEWAFENKDIVKSLMEKSNDLFAEKYGYAIYKKNTMEQLIVQSEADVVGIHFSENGASLIAVDVAFHEGGLNYGSKQETVERVVKKCIRTAMCLLGCFNVPYGEIVFASPKISSAICNDLTEAITDVNKILQNEGLEYEVKLCCNDQFEETIMAPVLKISSTVADTTELYLRGIQMYKMFYPLSTDKKKIIGKTPSPARISPTHKIAQSIEDIIPGYDNMKVAEIARNVLAPLLESGIVPEEEIHLMQTKEYSKEHFHLNYPLLLKINKEETRPIRYYLKPTIKIGETDYYLCSEWFEKPGANNDRPYLIKWIADHQ